MALGLLGEYSSHSDISNSDDEELRPTLPIPITNDGKSTQQEKPSEDEQEAKHTDQKTHQLSLFTVDGRDDDDDDSSSSSSEETENTIVSTTTTTSNLPLPDLDTKHHLTGSAFINPYKEAEEARMAVLKQHVADFAKEVDPPRGRRPWRHRNQRHWGNSEDGGGAQTQSDWSPEKQDGAKRKHRSGVVDRLIPPQKALKLHQEIQAKERPWTMGLGTGTHPT